MSDHRKASIRLTPAERAAVAGELAKLGADGEAALKRLEAAAKPKRRRDRPRLPKARP